MKRILIVAMLLAGTSAFAQDADTTYWRKSFIGGLNFNQSSFSDNWTGGGVNSVGLNGLLNYKANYLKGKKSWDNEIDMAFGFVNNDGTGYRKNNDRIFLDTKYGHALSDKWNMFASLNMVTQFAKGYKYEKDSLEREQATLVSEFMAPGYFTASWGLEYTPRPYFKMRFSPFAPRLTVVRNKQLYTTVDNNYGVPVGETTRWEWLAFQFIADFDKDLTENLNLKFKYMLYANLENLEANQIDHRLDAIFSAKVAKYVDVNLTAALLYDYDQIDEIQLSQSLGIGFLYTFKNFKDE
ncbi:MAG: DUF3078 domain-containing protein [Cyclobacteriaceae bacterium]|nr:DUF3078 domain-containing protein [Cyclobacteriaceae bacterium]